MQYEKLKDAHEHTLKRPDTYIGSVRSQDSLEYIAVVDDMKKDITIVEKSITYIPAILQIFVEVLSNAVDNVVRSKEFGTPCKSIKVDINKETGEITVWNDGLTIPIQQHEESGMWIPDMLFGSLFSSSNYNDNEQRQTSGRNGMGVSLCNIFSSQFKIKIVDPPSKQSYSQKWRNNMKKRGEPRINKTSSKKGFTEVSWIPDFEYFKTSNVYTDDFIALMSRYIVDDAMIVSVEKVSVYLNGIKLPVKQFKDYVRLYQPEGQKELLVLMSDTSECIITPSTTYEQISFVNGVHTKKGGVHVDAWADAIFRELSKKINSKYKDLKLTSKDVKQHFRIFVNCNVVNPEFATQSKNKMVAPRISVVVESKHISALMKWPFMDEIKKMIELREMMTLKKSERKRGTKKIKNFDPANNAGGKHSNKCTLVLCEGLSAKTYAVAGIQHGSYFGDTKLKGRDWYGLMPLRGKVLNVRKAKPKSILANEEIVSVIQALGVQHGVDYTQDSNFKQLQYGRLMILTDQDHDGYHIGGLILNLFDFLFPTLLSRHGFVTCMHTPIMKITSRNESLRFYDLAKAKRYIEQHPTKTKLKIKYYKGLGTSTSDDIKETFGQRVILYNTDEQARSIINRVFNDEDADFRKQWISDYKENTTELAKYDDHIYSMDISDFINHSLIQFSIEDCKRSIPHLMDGMKESNRKILYACILKNLSSEIKVGQLSGFVAEKTNYHHGEECLYDTIINMAQDFVGSNNIPLLVNAGAFGSRLSGGKDAASARYIYTYLYPITRVIFNPDDDDVLNYIDDDGDLIEPEFYTPIIPMILVNGARGIGTGWSSNIPCYNPKDLIEWVRCWISNGEHFPELIPWYRGFTGEIHKLSSSKFETVGKVGKTPDGKRIVITELPIGVWTDKYKEFLEDLMEARKIKQLKNYSKPDKVHFEFVEQNDFRATTEKLKLISTLTTTNLVLFDENNGIRKYDTVEDILHSFCKTRLQYYEKRKEYMFDKLMKEYTFVKHKCRFISYVNDTIHPLVIYRRDEKDIINEMEERGLKKKDDNYDYLLSLPVRSFSDTKMAQLIEKKNQLKQRIDNLQNKSGLDLWIDDLDTLELKLQ